MAVTPPANAPSGAPVRENPDSELSLSELRRRVRNLTFSRDLTREFMQSSGSLKKVIAVIFTRVLEVLEAEAGSLWLWDERSQQNICHLAEGPVKDRVIGLRLAPGLGIVGRVIAENTSIVSLDCSKDTHFASHVDESTGFRTLSMICVPLTQRLTREREPAIGAIQIINKRSGIFKQFLETDQYLVEDMALSAAIAVRNARLIESESRVKEMHILMEISRRITSTLDMDQVLALVVNRINELVEVSSGAVALWDEFKHHLVLTTLSGNRPVDRKDPVQKEMLALMEQIRQSGRALYISDPESYRQSHPEHSHPESASWIGYLERRGMKSLWATTLTDEEGILGLLWLESETPHFAANNKIDTLIILASQTTVALRNASLFRRIPFAQVLGEVGEKGQWLVSHWRKNILLAMLAVSIVLGLHNLPIFRSVSGPCVVDSRLGHGVFLSVAGRVKRVMVREGDRVNRGDLLAELDDTLPRLKLVETETRLAVLESQILEARAAAQTPVMSRAVFDHAAAQAEMIRARDDLNQVVIRAPMAGIVLTTRPEELLNRELPLGTELIRLAENDQLTVSVQIPEEDLTDLEKGQTVQGILRSMPGSGFRGVVVHVGQAYPLPMATGDKGMTPPPPPQGFLAEVQVTETDIDLRPGMTGQAVIHTPKSSVVTRFWRRLVNALHFWM